MPDGVLSSASRTASFGPACVSSNVRPMKRLIPIAALCFVCGCMTMRGWFYSGDGEYRACSNFLGPGYSVTFPSFPSDRSIRMSTLSETVTELGTEMRNQQDTVKTPLAEVKLPLGSLVTWMLALLVNVAPKLTEAANANKNRAIAPIGTRFRHTC